MLGAAGIGELEEVTEKLEKSRRGVLEHVSTTRLRRRLMGVDEALLLSLRGSRSVAGRARVRCTLAEAAGLPESFARAAPSPKRLYSKASAPSSSSSSSLRLPSPALMLIGRLTAGADALRAIMGMLFPETRVFVVPIAPMRPVIEG